MFDGTFKAARKVNMSGRRPPFASSATAAASKEQLVLEAKRAREERQEQRRRAAAATRVQALHRRLAAAAHARTAAFCALESELTVLVRATDIRATPVPTRALAGFLRQFWFAFGRDVRKNIGLPGPLPGPVDGDWVGMAGVSRQRVLNVQNYLVFMLLVSCLRGEKTPASNFLAATKDAAWVYQVTRLLEVALRMLTATRFASPLEKATSPYLLLLDTFSSAEQYPTARDAAVLSELMGKLAVHAQYGTFRALSDVVRDHALAGSSARAVAEDRVVQVVSSLVVIALRSQRAPADAQRRVTRQFASELLLTPSAVASSVGRYLLTRLAAADDDALEQSSDSGAAFWRAVVGVLSDEHAGALSWSERAIALGNIVDLLQLHAFERPLVQTACTVMSGLVSRSLVQWAFSVPEPFDDVEMGDSASAQSPLRCVDDAADKEAAGGVDALGPFAGLVRAQIEQLCDAGFSRRCLDAVMGASELPLPPSVDALRGFCATYAVVLLAADRPYLLATKPSFAPPAKPVFAFLSGVGVDQAAGAAGLLDRIWGLVERELRDEKRRHTGSASVAYSASVLNMLLVFSSIYSHVLLALDDEAFYDRAWPLPLPSAAAVVSSLKTFVYDTCWNAAGVGNALPATARAAAAAAISESTLFATVATTVKLLNQLYDRDCRRRFLPDGAWLWPAMPVIKETVDLESMEDDGQQDAQALLALLGGGSASAPQSPHARAALVLATLPQVFAFTDRVLLFEKLLDDEKAQLGHMRSEFAGALHVRVKRDEIVDQSFAFFQHTCATRSPAALKSKIKVTFVNEQGLEEAGIDGGGVFKEFMDALTKRAFAPEADAPFQVTPEQLLYPNPNPNPAVSLDHFRFLGRVLAKAVYENILVEPQFAAFFLNKLLGKANFVDDLRSLDPELHAHLLQLKHYTGDVAELALTFSVSEPAAAGGAPVTRELIPGGADVAVTSATRIRYIHLLANYKLNVLAASASAAFLQGFRDLIPAKWVQMFSPAELQTLLGGSANSIDVDDWERHTAYGGGYHPSQPAVQWFWDIVRHDFDAADRAALLKFITSCSRQPLLGFAQLAPPLCVHQVRTTEDERLPSSATCMNLLKLPTYSSKEIMRKKLLYAISANAGFDLS
ncbi:hypothetical protein PybrP1_000894 [[Pythium] brassicae (nom. inval.)]|nr:hypothetical protein PybrP1_000894 [[Pythium] brassicae (nom. inval.)]